MASERKAKADLRTFLAANEVNLAIKAAAKEQQQKVCRRVILVPGCVG